MSDLIIELKKPYSYEGTEHTEINLTGLEGLTGLDLIKAKQIYTKSGGFSTVLASDPEYCAIVAHIATKLPLDFFTNAPAKIYTKVTTQVMVFLMGDSDE